MNIEVSFVYAHDALSIKKYLKTCTNDYIINYIDVINKLTKGDIYSKEPSDIIVKTYILNEIENFIKSGSDSLYYVLSSLDINIIKTFIPLLKSILKDDGISIKCNFYLKNDISSETKFLDEILKLDYPKKVDFFT